MNDKFCKKAHTVNGINLAAESYILEVTVGRWAENRLNRTAGAFLSDFRKRKTSAGRGRPPSHLYQTNDSKLSAMFPSGNAAPLLSREVDGFSSCLVLTRLRTAL